MRVLWAWLTIGLAATAAAPAVRLVSLGDSFTIGTGTTPDHAFPARLVARWRARGVDAQLLNPARNGFTTDALIAEELPQLAAFHPTQATLAIGANDIVHGEDVAHYRANVRTIFAAVLAAGVKPERLWALPQPDWARSPTARAFGEPEAMEHQIVQFNGVLRQEAERVGARYVDLWPLMEKEAADQLIADDGLHPSERCYDAWAEALGALH